MVLGKLFNWVRQGNMPPDSWREGLIVVISKDGKDISMPSGYRPITILNHDYKLFTLVLANRLAITLLGLVHPDQTGFVPGRRTHDNVIRTLQIIEDANKKKKKVKLISLDAEKAFDRVEWNFLFEVLRKMGFPESFVTMIRNIYIWEQWQE